MRFKYKNNVGNHYYNRRKLKPGDIIDTDSIGGAIDKFEQLDPEPIHEEPKAGLKAVSLGGGKYDVFNDTTGKKINDEPLGKNGAELLTGKVIDEADDVCDDDNKSRASSSSDDNNVVTKMKLKFVKLDSDKFNVVDVITGKLINDKPMAKRNARQLIKDMIKKAPDDIEVTVFNVGINDATPAR